jgi:4-alpha-glucanotransferase
MEIKETQQAALQITGGQADTIATDMIRAAFSTDARLAIAPLQDYLGLGSEARINVPGTSSNNWRWRLQDGQLSPGVRGQVARMVEESGRSLQN